MLELTKITKSFTQLATPVLRDFSLKINRGDYCMVLGANGSGKSTLFKIIAGEYATDSGRILLSGRDITKIPAHKRAKYISSVSQDLTLGTVQELTLLENMALSGIRDRKATFRSYRYSEHEILNQIKSLNLGLEKYIESKMSSLSGGQRQAVATLMAFLPKPALLLLDEHTSALDPKSKRQIMSFTDQFIQQQEITTLMITHNVEDAIKFGNRLIIMHRGEIIAEYHKRDKANLTTRRVLDILHESGELLI